MIEQYRKAEGTHHNLEKNDRRINEKVMMRTPQLSKALLKPIGQDASESFTLKYQIKCT